jgi:drug/metabolite transporter (DMT)-like permease
LFTGLAVIGGPFGIGVLAAGMARLPLSIGSVVVKLELVFVVFIAWLAVRERLSARQFIYAITALAALFFVLQPDPSQFGLPEGSVLGTLLVLAGAASFGSCVVMARTLAVAGEDAATMSGVRFAIGLGLMLLIVAASGPLGYGGIPSLVTPRFAILYGAASGLANGAAFFFFYRGLRSVPANVATFLELITPGVAMLFGALWLGERVSITQVVGMVVLGLAVVGLAGAKKNMPAPPLPDRAIGVGGSVGAPRWSPLAGTGRRPRRAIMSTTLRNSLASMPL